jgi:hypothetical protein
LVVAIGWSDGGVPRYGDVGVGDGVGCWVLGRSGLKLARRKGQCGNGSGLRIIEYLGVLHLNISVMSESRVVVGKYSDVKEHGPVM